MRSPLLLVIAFALALGACGRSNSKVTPENYAAIKFGMSKDAVHQLLGDPGEVSGHGISSLTMLNETWHGDRGTIHVSFVNDKVMVTSLDAE